MTICDRIFVRAQRWRLPLVAIVYFETNSWSSAMRGLTYCERARQSFTLSYGLQGMTMQCHLMQWIPWCPTHTCAAAVAGCQSPAHYSWQRGYQCDLDTSAPAQLVPCHSIVLSWARQGTSNAKFPGLSD